MMNGGEVVSGGLLSRGVGGALLIILELLYGTLLTPALENVGRRIPNY